MVRVGDRVIYGAGLSRTGAARPYYYGREAVVLEVDSPLVGMYKIQFDDGLRHICPRAWVRKVQNE